MVRQTNPGSAAYCAWSQQNGPNKALIFSSIFISFKGVIDGVGAGCRSLIGVDGTHLKGNYGGILKDCNRGDDWCIMSDRQKGIDPALTELWPEVKRSATSPFTFKKAMNRIKKANHLALVWLSKLGDQERWTKHKYDPKICSDENTSNFVESSNATLGVDRCRPILTLLEGIRRVCMTRIASRRQKCQDWNNADPCPNIVKRIRKLMHDSRTCKAYQSRKGEYEIMEGKSMLPVSLNNKNCICGVWQTTGIPCRHAIRAILAAGYDPHRYVSTWYSGRAYKQAYAHHINTIPDHEHWP
ncbi:uncharacterized protein LOC110716379 [Chenopodium quinoa]|uniref:uncharacterized protein LOC110716379 n=1 Tax=Chenopodium quinoa TaxID=63459 RepID=UPI000B792856|nr:uncharacterized protein LOC110716379 [Chenopodium quinoa]